MSFDLRNKINPNIHSIRDERVTDYFCPVKILWQYTGEGAEVENSEVLLREPIGQATLEAGELCILRNHDQKAGILLDFGIEMQGGIQLVTHLTGGKVRVRFGESAMEAMSDVGQKGATNDHAIRDGIYAVSWLGMTAIGNTGFRFCRIDLEGENCELHLKSVRAAMTYRDIPCLGSFECDDERLNAIWRTAAYTVQLNMQEYVWDGVKRDRLVWIGDMHPEVSTIDYVFGQQNCVEKSLDLAKNNTPVPQVMNGIPAYSLWWILIQRDHYLHTGDRDYLEKQHDYIVQTVRYFSTLIAENGESLIENNFLDWPSSVNPEGQKAGVQALFVLSMKAAADILNHLSDTENAVFAAKCAEKLRQHVVDANGLKQAAALQVLAGQIDAGFAYDDLLGKNGVHGFSTFLGYYILKAIAEAGQIDFALNCIREYWGAMLDLGATTFWEDFDIDWTENCSRVDELLPEDSDKKDIHGDFGGYCYSGYRHSFCHGWASGPAPFLMQYVLGIMPIADGCKRIRLNPQLGSLQYAKGSFPTPKGLLTVCCEKQPDGTIDVRYTAPDGIEIVF